MTFSSQMETGGFDVLKSRQMEGVTASLSKLLGSPSLHFLHRQGALWRFITELCVDRPSALTHSPGATAFVSLFECSVHEVKRLISSCRAIHGEPLYSMGPFSTIVRVTTIALCFDTLHTGPECALDSLVWRWSVVMFASKILTCGRKLNFCTVAWPAH